MIFAPDMVDAILSGRKTVTRRLASRPGRWYPGREYAVQPGRGKMAIARIRVVSVRGPEDVALVDDADAMLEGFLSREQFLARWETLYGGRLDSDVVWRIEFELVTPA